MRLLAIPWASARAAQYRHDLMKPLEAAVTQRIVLAGWDIDQGQVPVTRNPIQLKQRNALDPLLARYPKGMSHNDRIIVRQQLHQPHLDF